MLILFSCLNSGNFVIYLWCTTSIKYVCLHAGTLGTSVSFTPFLFYTSLQISLHMNFDVSLLRSFDSILGSIIKLFSANYIQNLSRAATSLGSARFVFCGASEFRNRNLNWFINGAEQFSMSRSRFPICLTTLKISIKMSVSMLLLLFRLSDTLVE